MFKKSIIAGIAVWCMFFLHTTIVMATTTTSTTSEISLAQYAGCTGIDCSACNLVNLANGIIVWLIGLLCLLCAVILAAAGFGLLTSGGNHHALDEAKSKFTNALIGMLIVLSAWLVVDTIMRGLVGDATHDGQINQVTGWLYWTQVQCQEQTVPDKFEEWVEEYFVNAGENSFQVYTYNAAQSCLVPYSQTFPNINACRSSLSSAVASGAYVVQGCDGQAGTAPQPAWLSKPVCGNLPVAGGGMTLSLAGGGTATVLACEPGASDRVTVPLFGHSAYVHKNLAASVRRIDAAWRAKGGNSFYPVTSVGGYNCRNIAGTNRKSVHAYGLAIDINPATNPHNKPGPLVTDMPAAFRQIFLNEGWGWGGNWNSSKDAMHFSKATNEQGNMRGE